MRDVVSAAGEPRFVVAACFVGLLTGLASIALAEMIHLVQVLAIGAADLPVLVLPALPWAQVLLVPAAGGLAVGVIGHYLSREVRGHGVPEVMEAVALRGGRIRKRVAVAKSVASALTIGTGGSVGREGPIVQIGASVGSAVGQALGLSADRLRTLTSAGAAGGIAAAFNAPIAGAFFALEVIARNFATPTFGPVVLCAVFATLVSRAYFGDSPAFEVPPFQMGPLWETPLALVLGLICGFVSLGFIGVLGALERFFERIPTPALVKPALGGLLLGVLLLKFPELYGVGYETMDATLSGNLPWRELAFLLALKPLATSITLASGGSGGVFLPSLYVGGLAGGLFGIAVNAVFPETTTSQGAYALVGMAAVLAGTSHAPITALLLAFEMTQDYVVILPVMLATAVATLVARGLKRDSIYTEKLTQRGIDLDRREDLVLRGIRVSEVMHKQPPAVRSDAPLDVVLANFLNSDFGAVFVTNPDGFPVGQTSIHDIKSAIGDPDALGAIVVAGDVCESVATVRQSRSLADALDVLSREGREVIGVTDEDGKLVGALTLRSTIDVIARRALRGEVVGVTAAAAEQTGTRDRQGLRLTRGLDLRTLDVRGPLTGQTVRSLDVRSRWKVSVIALRIDGVDQGVEPDRALNPGDTLVVMGEARDLDRFMREVWGPGPNQGRLL